MSRWMLYLDASALAKLIRDEAETEALEAEIGDDRIATSLVGHIELRRALVLQPELDAFVVYDRRLAEAAAALGLPVSSPGAAA